jgi:hypothetical protein
LWQWKKDLLEEANLDDPYGWYVECTETYIDLIKQVAPDAKIIVDWVNEDGVPLTIVSSKAADDNHVELTANGEAVAAEDCVRKLAEHFGLTIS